MTYYRCVPAEGGIKFGNYVLLRRIARGGMAEVFLAQQRGLEGFDRRVAVKRILPHLADSPDFVKMFLSEARLAAQLSHPNVVHIYDFGKVDHDYFIAMEFVDGVHVGELFKLYEREKLPPTLVARIGADAANALHYAHELRGTNGKPLHLVHRDVSPANVMVSFDGTVKLCDFGIAKAAALGDQLTNPGQVKGKYAYMSPEQTIASPLDGRSDVFSLSILLWELLAGKTIVGRGDAVDAMRAIRDGKLQPIEKAAPATPAPLARAITWGLETQRDKRATAMDLAQALEAFIKAAPELAMPMQLGSWIRTRFPRESTDQHPTATGTAAAVSGTHAAATPPKSLIAASRLTPYIDDHTETIAVGPPSMTAPAHTTVAREPSVILDPDTTAEAGETILRGATTEGDTMLRSGAFRVPVAQTGRRMRTRATTETTLDVMRRRGPRMLIAIAALIALATISFLIVLSTRTRTKAAALPIDAAIDAAPDAQAIEVAPPDVATVEAQPDATSPTTLVEVITKPDGAIVKVGDQTRTAPAQFALPAGHYVVIAELAGFAPERREIDLVLGDHLKQEIAFTHKLGKPVPPKHPKR